MSIVNGERVLGNATPPALITFAAAAAGTTLSADQTNELGRGVQVIVVITVATTTAVVVTIQGYDAASATYYDLLTSASLVSAATTLLTLYPGVTVVSNVAVSAPLPKTWRVKAVVTGASSALTATIGANVIV